jgi:hypothetical protein
VGDKAPLVVRPSMYMAVLSVALTPSYGKRNPLMDSKNPCFDETVEVAGIATVRVSTSRQLSQPAVNKPLSPPTRTRDVTVFVAQNRGRYKEKRSPLESEKR